MSRAPDASPRRADALANRDALLDAAAHLLATRGPAVSYEEIAEAAGVGRATLYRHFPTREQLLGSILDRVLDDLELLFRNALESRQDLLAILEAIIDVQQRHLAIIDLAAQRTSSVQRQRVRERFDALLRGPLEQAQDAGVIGRELSVADLRVVLLMLSALARPTTPSEDRARAVKLVHSMLIGARP